MNKCYSICEVIMEKKDIRKLAKELLISLTPEEEEVFKNEFAYFSEQAKKLEALPLIDKVQPMFFPINEERDYLREDIPEEPFSPEEILSNSRNAKDGFVVIPKVVK